jgi:hypothetical protein
VHYDCSFCNAAKSDRLVPDPTAVLLAPDVSVSSDGAIHSNTTEAARLIDSLGLNRPRAREFRALWIGIIKLAFVHDPDLYQRLMGFPDDLPDLARLRPPGGNTRREGVKQSYFAQKQQGTLPATH